MADATIKLTIGGFTVEVSGTEEYVDRTFDPLVEKFLPAQFRSGNVAAIGPESPVTAEITDATGKKLAPAEFLRKLSHTNQLDRALALGYYLEKMQNVSSFTTKELLELSKQVKYPFANISESVSRLVGRGLMMSAGDKEGVRAYSITATGEQMIDSMATKA
jgi:hypothetical protein